MDYIEKFYSYLEELYHSYSRMGDLLREKMAAVEKFNINKLDDIMKEEQVYVLLSKGFDNNIHTYRDKLSLKGDTLSAVIEELPEEHRERFRQQFKRLKTSLDEAKGLNEKCQALIEERLYSLDKSIKEHDKSEGSTYRRMGDAKNGPAQGSHLFTKLI